MKEQIFGRSAASLFGLDVDAKRKIPGDYLSRIKMAYPAEGPQPSHRGYGWVTD